MNDYDKTNRASFTFVVDDAPKYEGSRFMKNVEKKSKRKSINLALIRAALFGACVVGLGTATCEAQAPSWPKGGPPHVTSKEAKAKMEERQKATEEKAFEDQIKKDLVQRITQYQQEVRAYVVQKQAEAERQRRRAIIASLAGRFVPVDIPGPLSIEDIIRDWGTGRLMQKLADWGISILPSVPYVNIPYQSWLREAVDGWSSDASWTFDYQQESSTLSLRQALLSSAASRVGDQRAVSASNFALGENVSINEKILIAQRQSDRIDARFNVSAFYAKGDNDERLDAERRSVATRIQEIDAFSDSVKATFYANQRLASSIPESVQKGISAKKLVDDFLATTPNYLTPNYFASLRKTRDIFAPELLDDARLLRYAKAFNKNDSALGVRTWSDQYQQQHTTPNLYAADLFERYGVVCMRRGREYFGENGESLTQIGESLLDKSLEIAEKRFANEPYYRVQWLTLSAIRCQCAGLNERAFQLYEESENVAATALKSIKTNPTRQNAASRQNAATTQNKTLKQMMMTRRVWNAEMASRAMLLDDHFEEAQKYLEIVVDAYEIQNDSKYDGDENARLTRELCAEAKTNAGLAKFLADFDVDASLTLEDAKENFEICEDSPFVVEERIALLCRLAQLDARVEKYDDALRKVDFAIELKRNYLGKRTKDWGGHRRYFTTVPKYFDAVYVADEACDAAGEIYKLSDEELEKRKETWESIVESRLSYEKILKASILNKRGDPTKEDLKESLAYATEILETLDACELDKTHASAQALLTRAQIRRRLSSSENLLAAREDLEKASKILKLTCVPVEELEKKPNANQACLEGVYACELAHVERELAALGEEGDAERATRLYDVAEQYFKAANLPETTLDDLRNERAVLNRGDDDKE